MLRTAHGRARDLGALVVAETAPVDELPAGVPAAPESPVERRSNGTFTSAGARALGRRGGAEAARRTRFATLLADQLGMATVDPEMQPYVDGAKEFALAQRAHLAATVGGGVVGPGPASMVQSAALALAASRYLYARGSSGDAKLLGQAARLADQSRAALLTAHELAAREAQARAAHAEPLDLAAALGATSAEVAGQ